MASNDELKAKIAEMSKALGRDVPDLASLQNPTLTKMFKDLTAEVAAAEAVTAGEVAAAEAAEAAEAAAVAEAEAAEAATAAEAAEVAEAAALAAAADAAVMPKPKVVLANNRAEKAGHYVAKGASITAPGQRILTAGTFVSEDDLALEHRKVLEAKGVLELRK